MHIEIGQRAVNGGRGTELHVRTKVVPPSLAVGTATTWDARLNGYPIT